MAKIKQDKKNKEDEISAINGQSMYKKPFLHYILSNSVLSFSIKLFFAWLLSLIMARFGLFEDFGILIAYLFIEIVAYNLNDDLIKP